ncbi:MAG: HEAT repeat domain-containing protein, partial [Candidatus Anstonellales archaeon]
MKKLKNVGIILGFGIVATGLFFKPDRIWANQNVQVEQSMNQDSTRSAEVERYIKDLKSKDPNIRVNAVMALDKIGDVRAI